MDPLTRSIQAKLINNGGLIDATPGALPIYFGSDVQIKVEQISGAVIAGKSESTFWIDTRPTWEQQTPPTMEDLQQVFVIKTEGELDDETAETMESQIVTNQDQFAYFTNFDHWIDYVTLSLWVLGLLSLLAGASMIFMGGEQESHRGTKWADGSTQPEPRINLADEISTEAAELEETVEQTESAE